MVQPVGVGGWPLTRSRRHPGELSLTCPHCKAQNATLGTAPGAFGTGPNGRWRLGDQGGHSYVKCGDCDYTSFYTNEAPKQEWYRILPKAVRELRGLR